MNPTAPSAPDVVKLLNDALATELVCVLRYQRHHAMAEGLSSPRVAREFLAHAHAESVHAQRLAQRIVQLGARPDFSPGLPRSRGQASDAEPMDLPSMVRANLVAERIAVESYRQMISLIGDRDPTTRHLLENILADEEQHAGELKDWLDT